MSGKKHRQGAVVVEALEGRALLSVTADVVAGNAASIDPALEAVTALRTTLQNELGSASLDGAYDPSVLEDLQTNAGDVRVLVLTGDNASNRLTIDGRYLRRVARGEGIDVDQIDAILYLGGTGNDRITNATNLPLIAFDAGGNNRIEGGGADDLIVTGLGNDQISGRGGDDLLVSDAALNFGSAAILGDLTQLGQGGNDRLEGGNGLDILLAGPGNDRLEGGSRADILVPGSGNDRLNSDTADRIVNDFYADDTTSGGNDGDEDDGGDGDDDDDDFRDRLPPGLRRLFDRLDDRGFNDNAIRNFLRRLMRR